MKIKGVWIMDKMVFKSLAEMFLVLMSVTLVVRGMLWVFCS